MPLAQHRAVGVPDVQARLGQELESLLVAGSGEARRADMARAYGGLELPCGPEAVRALADAVEGLART